MSTKKQIVREEFRNACYKRDRHRCVFCGKTEPLNAHHITDRNEMPNGGYVKENGITLCDGPDSCHMKAERFHISSGQEWEPGMHPDDLYAKIGSSYEKAIEASKRL